MMHVQNTRQFRLPSSTLSGAGDPTIYNRRRRPKHNTKHTLVLIKNSKKHTRVTPQFAYAHSPGEVGSD